MIPALIGAVLVFALLAPLVLDARRQLVVERARVADLLARLAARTHGEYAAFTAPPAPAPEPSSWRFDPTGMIGVEDDGE